MKEGCFFSNLFRYFSAEKAGNMLENVPSCFLVVGTCYVVLQLVGALLLCDPGDDRVRSRFLNSYGEGFSAHTSKLVCTYRLLLLLLLEKKRKEEVCVV